MRKIAIILSWIVVFSFMQAYGQGLTHTANSPYAKVRSIGLNDVQWTSGFWAERFDVCANSMVPHMLGNYMDPGISHAFRNFEIAAGLEKGDHVGPPFHDGDFYKILEGAIMVNAIQESADNTQKIDSIISVIASVQREDGYIHTPVLIEALKNQDRKREFEERLDFETYNLGHLMTAGCVHYRTTGKRDLLDVAVGAADFLHHYYLRDSIELAYNAICPSHYMGIVEIYRTTGENKYLDLANSLIRIRRLVEEGTDHNQDRISFYQQTEAMGHAVRANYLYAGAADVYLENGLDSLWKPLNLIWEDLVNKKLYITGGCGALYDGVSPNGTTYDQPSIQQVHQAYGREYQLPNITAHNESCANIGNLLWNWRMLQISGDAKYADIIETTLYNAILAGVSLDGKGYFYTNPMSVADELSHDLRWSKIREPYISYCNCCPPNTVRTIAQVQNYAYALAENGIYVNLYGGNELTSRLRNGEKVHIIQETDYPWDEKIKLIIEESSNEEFSVYLRIPGWSENASVFVNGEKIEIAGESGIYTELRRKWQKGDEIELILPFNTRLMSANPLVEELRGQVAVQRGPVVYCLESADIPEEYSVFDVVLPAAQQFNIEEKEISNSRVMFLKGQAKVFKGRKQGKLYHELPAQGRTIPIKLVPYYAWGNRGEGEMTVWLPVSQ